MLLIGPVDEEARDHDLEELIGVINILGVVVGVGVVNISMVVGRVVVDISVDVGRVVIVSMPGEVGVSAVDIMVKVSAPVAVSVPESGNSVMLEEAARQISLTSGSSICFFLERLARLHPMQNVSMDELPQRISKYA